RFQDSLDKAQGLGFDPGRGDGRDADRAGPVSPLRLMLPLPGRVLDFPLDDDAAARIVPEDDGRSESTARGEREGHARVGVLALGVLPYGGIVTGALQLRHRRVEDRPDGGRSGPRLEAGAWRRGGGDRIAARTVQESGEGHAPSLETFDRAFADLLGSILERVDHLPGGLIALAALAEAAMNHFFQVIAARQPADIAAPHRAVHIAAEQHRDELADLIDVVALLPLAHLPPRDLGGRAQRIERIGGDAAPARLMGRNAEVAELQLLAFADKDIEGGQVTVQRLAAMQHVEGLEDRGDLVADEFLRLSAFRRE